VADARRVLIADDEEPVRELLAAFFDKTYADRGYVVETVADGAAAIDAVRRAAFALILLDIEMPGIDGVTAFREIRRLQPRVPVIMVTGNDSRRLASELTALGVFSYMPKPIRLTYLEHIVGSLFDTPQNLRRTR
jgi:two-component system, NtrC family, response regulator AtoC